jgi:hypothetical protein
MAFEVADTIEPEVVTPAVEDANASPEGELHATAREMIDRAAGYEDISDDDTSVASEEVTDDVQAVSTDDNSGEESHDTSVQERAQALGVSDALAKSFDSVSELERYVRLRDIETGVTTGKPENVVTVTTEAKPTPAKTDAPAAPEADAELLPLNIDVERLREDGESDHVIAMAETLIKQNQQLKTLQTLLEGSNPQELATRFQAIEQRYQQELHQQVVDHFDSIVDGLNLPEFGKTIDKSGKIAPLPETAKAKRQELWDMATTLDQIQQKKGTDMPIEVLVQRALLQLASPAEQEAKVRQKVVGKLTAQSNKRLGSGNGKRTSNAEQTPEEIDRELIAMARTMLRG